MDERKFCFIICSNNEEYLEECFFYINRLEVPEGYSIDAVSIFDAESMTSGYNEAMNATDAKYKIYLHQDVFIIYKGFLQAVLDIFQSDSTIGMIGMVGAPKMPVGGVMWLGHREGMLYGSNDVKGDYRTYQYQLKDGLHEVEAVDGLMMITSADIPWREDKFDGWDFYDVSQSFEFRRYGYKVVVPEQLCPWCKHDDGALNLRNYDKYRKICIEEYPEYFARERFCVVKNSKASGKDKTRVVMVARNQLEAVKSTIESIKAFSNLDVSQIIVVDNGSEDGLRHWLKSQQEMDYIICEEVIEGYGAVLNEALQQFVVDADVLLVSPGMMMLPGCMEALYNGLEGQQMGAVCARLISKESEEGKCFSDAARYAMTHAGDRENKEVQRVSYEAVLITHDLLQKVGGFDERLCLPDSVMYGVVSKGAKYGYHFYEIQNAFMYKIMNGDSVYSRVFGEEPDRMILAEEK
ncbi:MAG: glycosyltransferase [Lachnospiraceae bacterium]|nr:glycosyltransferase [Lachnospiraceae bacterium]